MFFRLPPWLMLANALLNQGSLLSSWALWCRGGDRDPDSCTKRCTLTARLICMPGTPSFLIQARLPGVQGRAEGHGTSDILAEWACSITENTQVHIRGTCTVCVRTCIHLHSGKRYKTRLFPGEPQLMTVFPKAWFKLRFFSCAFTNAFLLCVS